MNKLWREMAVVFIFIISFVIAFNYSGGGGGASGSSTTPFVLDKDSPFGSHAAFCMPPLCNPSENYLSSQGYSDSKIIDYLSDIGIKWVRLIEPELEKVANKLSENNINVISGIARTQYPGDVENYKKDTKKIVKEYKNSVKAWLFVNEADGGWHDTPEKYADYLILTSKIIKSECPDCLVVLSLAGGQVENGQLRNKGPNFFDLALKNGTGEYFDVLDIHFQGTTDNYQDLKIKTSAFKEVFKKYGVKEKPIWLCEMATYDGKPDPSNPRQPDWPYQTEKQQASGLIKRYVFGLSLGIQKMFWSQMIELYQYKSSTNDYFTNVGLIHNGKIDSKFHKKLSYYTYQKMTEILEGSDWNNIETVVENSKTYPNVYVYKFTKQGKPIWVAWNDSSQDEQITISGVTSTQVKITEAVPKYETGKNVTDYNTAFKTETKNVQNGKIMLTLSNVPVFVEMNNIKK